MRKNIGCYCVFCVWLPVSDIYDLYYSVFRFLSVVFIYKMATYETVELKRRQIKAQLTRFSKFFDSVTPPRICELETRLEQIKTVLSEFNEIQTQLELLNDDELMSEERDKFESKYFRLISDARAYIDTQNASAKLSDASGVNSNVADVGSTPLSAISPSGTCSSKNVKLPTLDLPKFYGDYEDWLHFHDTFNALVHNDPSIDDVNKFYYLKSCLKGDAAKTLLSLEVTRANYAIAWDVLTERYEDKEAIINTHVKGILDLPSVTKESHVHLRRLIDGYQRHTPALSSLGEPVQQWSTLLVTIIVRKLDEGTRLKWEERSGDKITMLQPDINSLISFLTSRCNILEKMDSNSKRMWLSVKIA